MHLVASPQSDVISVERKTTGVSRFSVMRYSSASYTNVMTSMISLCYLLKCLSPFIVTDISATRNFDNVATSV